MRAFTVFFLFILGILTSSSIAQDSLPSSSSMESENAKKETVDCDCKCPPPPPPPVCDQVIETSNPLSDASIKKALDAIERAESAYGE